MTGSEDETTAALDAAFDLVELPVGDRMKIPTQPVLRYFAQPQRPPPACPGEEKTAAARMPSTRA